MPRPALAALTALAWGGAGASLVAQPAPSVDTTYAPTACASVTAAPGADRVDAYVAARMRAGRVPGVSLALLRDGRVDARAYGYAVLEHCVRADTTTLFGVGSLSKMLTAYATLRLAEAGRLSIDDSVTKWLPRAAPAWNGITLRHLLSHTSGIRDYPGDDPFHPQIEVDRKAELTSDSLIGVFAAAPLNFAAGAEWAYSNTGYIVLSVVLEQVTGKPFPELMREWVYEPLGMRSTRSWDPRAVVPGLAAGYGIRDGALVRGRYVSAAFGRYGDTGILSTASDLSRFAAELLTPAHVSPALVRRMTTPAVDLGWLVPYGFGIVADELRGVPTLTHSGGFVPGYSSYFLLLPTRRTGVIVITNDRSDDPGTLARTVAQLLDSTLAPARATALDRDAADRTRRVLALVRGDSTALPLTAEYRRSGYPVFQRGLRGLPAPPDSLVLLRCDPLPVPVVAVVPAGTATECEYRMYLGGGGGPPVGVSVLFTRAGAVAGVRAR